MEKFWGENVRLAPTSITSEWIESTESRDLRYRCGCLACLFTFVGASGGHVCESTAFLFWLGLIGALHISFAFVFCVWSFSSIFTLTAVVWLVSLSSNCFLTKKIRRWWWFLRVWSVSVCLSVPGGRRKSWRTKPTASSEVSTARWRSRSFRLNRRSWATTCRSIARHPPRRPGRSPDTPSCRTPSASRVYPDHSSIPTTAAVHGVR